MKALLMSEANDKVLVLQLQAETDQEAIGLRRFSVGLSIGVMGHPYISVPKIASGPKPAYVQLYIQTKLWRGL